MDSIDEVIQTASIGRLDCGCPFDRDGVRPVGERMTCDNHRVPALVVASTTVTADGLLVA
ncbi:hypothetical protein BAY61_32365 (plasmid) [Prauserella marina]|uniref:Uncharacterized protein n=1 Tax=Prauserella marina TaxID=530584 RepID=A0A222W199_9PSEU|nr:hypothetical protein [Prauserella marina]ASR39976.1 hypothetical protein BAY61_32365 [Prauserella marina]PWV71315.1 hypothetical protein DES30_11231 [Prauserella marina]SDD96717.1 hypothetical protein SAMN05421630_11581 [Prauserella marina]